MANGRMTITEVAKILGVTPKTITRWEKTGKVKKSRRDWRGWRVYEEDDLLHIKEFFESLYESQ
jgi:DNA-binding transcriptional MerR regulator